MRSVGFGKAVAALSVMGMLFAAVIAHTVPRYSARYEQDCNLCHFNPTGGGHRSTYATQYLVPDEMAMRSLSDEERENLSPEISNSVTIGADLRTFFFSSDLPLFYSSDLDNPLISEDFFQMQGNLYLAFQMTNRISAHMSRGITSSFELFGLAYVLPMNGYVKVGRFVPPYGWRLDDHTAFVRDFMGFFPPGHTDVGLELGTYPGEFWFNLAVMNGQNGSIRDANDNLALVGRGFYRTNLGGVALGAGASVLRNVDLAGERVAWGPLAYLHLDPVTWIGEFDVSRTDSTAGETGKSWFTSHELTVRLRQGLDLKGTFDFWDPERKVDSGQRMRYGVGVDVMPYPFVRIDVRMNFYRNQAGAEGMAFDDPRYLRHRDDYNQIVGQVHFFY